MTRQEADDILGYVAQNLLSPMAFDGRPTSETWEIMIGTPFHNLCTYVYKMIDKTPKVCYNNTKR